MAFQKSYDELPLAAGDACVHLRSKSLYVTGEMDRGEGHEIAGRHYWCNQTQHTVGPDALSVLRASCVEGRDCYCSTR